MVKWFNSKISIKMMALVAIFIGSTLLTSCEEGMTMRLWIRINR